MCMCFEVMCLEVEVDVVLLDDDEVDVIVGLCSFDLFM